MVYLPVYLIIMRVILLHSSNFPILHTLLFKQARVKSLTHTHTRYDMDSVVQQLLRDLVTSKREKLDVYILEREVKHPSRYVQVDLRTSSIQIHQWERMIAHRIWLKFQNTYSPIGTIIPPVRHVQITSRSSTSSSNPYYSD